MAPTEQQAKQQKALVLAGKKKTKARVQRYLQSTAPQLRESTKRVLLLKGTSCSNQMTNILREMRALAAPHAKLLTKTNPIALFHDTLGVQSLEFLLTKNDASLFAMASHNKKRPNNLVMGRTFDNQILDMAELGIVYFQSMKEAELPTKRLGSKPLLLFQGDVWQQRPDFRCLQNLLTDFYRGDVVDKLVTTGLDHVLAFSAAAAADGEQQDRVLVHQRTYVAQVRPGEAARLHASGPNMDFVLRRTQWCTDPDILAASQKQQSSRRGRSRKNKNHSTNLFGETVGRLHLERQSVDTMGGRKSKALRRAEQAVRAEEQLAIEADLVQEARHEQRE